MIQLIERADWGDRPKSPHRPPKTSHKADNIRRVYTVWNPYPDVTVITIPRLMSLPQ